MGTPYQAVIVQQSYLPADYVQLRADCPALAQTALPRQQVHIVYQQLTTQPYPFMQVNADEGWIEVLYPITDAATQALSQAQQGQAIELQLAASPAITSCPQRALLLSQGSHFGGLVFLLSYWRQRHAMPLACSAIIEADAFPFRARPSQLIISGMPAGVIAAAPLLEDWQVASRLATPDTALVGCFEGTGLALAQEWLQSLSPMIKQELTVIAFGNTDWVQQVEAFKQEFALL